MVHRNGTSDLGVAQERENERSSLLRNEVKYEEHNHHESNSRAFATLPATAAAVT
jgi:hypothetical protein